MAYELVIGNKNYSSWSFRPWLAMTVAGIPFTETLVPLKGPFNRSQSEVLAHSPAGKVPVLKADGLVIWETLAILEYLAERHPEAKLWPDDVAQRAIARAMAADMHAGFEAVRGAYPMNMRRPVQKIKVDAVVVRDVERMVGLWASALDRSGGPFLFGAFTNADAMFAPVVSRFETYQATDDTTALAYMNSVTLLPAYKAWQDAALAETWIIPEDEV